MTPVLEKGSSMQTIMRSLILGTSLAALAAPFGSALAEISDPLTGTWKLNIEKSTFGGPRSDIHKFESAGKEMKYTREITTGNGTSRRTEWTGRYDGKDYPIKGHPSVDASSFKHVDARTVRQVSKKKGAPAFKYTREISRDGKTMTVTEEAYARLLFESSDAFVLDRTQDPAMGTWTLNVAKSTFSGPAPKSETNRFESVDDGIRISTEGITGAGAAAGTQYIGYFDGKASPVSGSPFFETATLQRVDARTVRTTFKKGDSVRAVFTRSVAKDAKSMTTAQTFHSKYVYEKQ